MKLRENERGISTVETVLLLGLVAVVGIGAFRFLGSTTRTKVLCAASTLLGGTGGAACGGAVPASGFAAPSVPHAQASSGAPGSEGAVQTTFASASDDVDGSHLLGDLVPAAYEVDPRSAEEDAALKKELTERFGRPPVDYRKFFDGSNKPERDFLRTLPKATEYLNGLLEQRGYSVRVTAAELALNFLAEGGGDALYLNTDRLSTFYHAGADILLVEPRVVPWLHPRARKLLDTPDWERSPSVNEKGEERPGAWADVEQALYANAGIYVWSKTNAARDLLERGVAMEDLPPAEQAYWTTVYYNAGEAGGRAVLRRNGPELSSKPFTGRNSWQDPRRNAAGRAASYEFLRRSLIETPEPTLAGRNTAAPI